MQRRSSRRPYFALAVAAALVSGAVGSARAQQRVFDWTGVVDHDVDITIRGNNFLATRIGSDERVSQGKSSLTIMPLTRTGELSLTVLEGRGAVEIAQQPTAESGYTGVIRIHDIGPGSGRYHIAAYWQAAEAGEVVAPGELVRSPAPAVSAPPLLSNRTALIWSGDVDSEIEIIIQPGSVTYNTLRGDPPRALQSALSQMPWPTAVLDMNQIEGRGEASVTQQPTADNGFTGKIRVRDPQPGFGHYAFVVMWR
jgi:hypothetical protein